MAKLSDLRFHLTRVSSNVKTGPIPVSTSSKATCPASCPFAGNGCYAESGPLALHWAAVTRGERGQPLREFMAAIAALPAGQLWRHGQAGDFPHTAGRISRRYLRAIIAANRGRNGYTYSHHSLAIGENASLIRSANRNGFTVNVSTESMAAADSAIAAGLPAVLAVPSDERGTSWRTPAGNRVIVCPAQRSDTTTCADCKLCHKRPRNLIIAFIAHGTGKRKASAAIAAKGAES
jgi:hypothetical protein